MKVKIKTLQLRQWRAVQLCRVDPPHNFEEFFKAGKDEEHDDIDAWGVLAEERVGPRIRRRPDLPLDEDHNHPWPFYCSLLKTIRRCPDVREGVCSGQGQLRDEPQTPDSLMDSLQTIINQEYSSPTRSSPRAEQEVSQFSSTCLLDSLNLQRFLNVQLCSDSPPHCCEEYWHNHHRPNQIGLLGPVSHGPTPPG